MDKKEFQIQISERPDSFTLPAFIHEEIRELSCIYSSLEQIENGMLIYTITKKEDICVNVYVLTIA